MARGPVAFALARQRLLLAAIVLAGAALVGGGAAATPLPPLSGDWVLDPAEVVFVNATSLTVEGNITLQAGSELHLIGAQLVFSDAAAKRTLFAPAGSLVTLEDSALSASRGPRQGGFGYYLRVDGTLLMDRSSVTGLSGPTIPNPFGETEGIHLTTSTSRISNSSITGAEGYAVTVTVVSTAASPQIADNTIENSGGGIFLGGFILLGANAVIERNSFTLNTFPHIASSGSSPTIESNSFVGSSAGVAALLGSPSVLNNSFIGNLLNAVSITQGGGRIEGNTVAAAGVAFVATSSLVSIRNNTVTLSATGLQASASTVTFDDNRVTGAFATALLVNGSTVTARNNALESSLGTLVMRATNGSIVVLAGGSLSSSGGPGVSTEGGSLTLISLNLSATLAPLSTSDTALTLRGTGISGGPTDPVVALRGGSLSATGGEVSGGDDGVLVDGAASSFNRTYIHGNAGWGIHAVHVAPQLSFDQIGAFTNANGQGDLLYEADLTVLVLNDRSEPVANASVAITSALGGPPLTGVTGTDGRAGPVRLQVRRVDSLNNEMAWTPYTIRASFPQDFRGVAAAALAADEEATIVLLQNSAPSGTVSGPASAVLGELVSVTANATDADGDPLTFQWSVDDGRTYIGPAVHLSFNTTGVRLLTVGISDGFETAVRTHNITVLTPAQANQPPRFLSDPPREAHLFVAYAYEVFADDPDSTQPVLLQLLAGPSGMTISYPGPNSATLAWEPARYYSRGLEPLDIRLNISLRAWDGLSFSYQNFTLVIKHPPDLPPSLGNLTSLVVAAGQSASLDLRPFAADPDDAVEILRWRITLPNETGGALIVLEAEPGPRITVRAPESFEGTRIVLITVFVEDPAGRNASATLHVELRGNPPAGAGLDAAVVASALAAAALGLAGLALFEARRRARKE